MDVEWMFNEYSMVFLDLLWFLWCFSIDAVEMDDSMRSN